MNIPDARAKGLSSSRTCLRNGIDGHDGIMWHVQQSRQILRKVISGLLITSPTYFKLLLEGTLTQYIPRLVAWLWILSLKFERDVTSNWNQNFMEAVIESQKLVVEDLAEGGREGPIRHFLWYGEQAWVYKGRQTGSNK